MGLEEAARVLRRYSFVALALAMFAFPAPADAQDAAWEKLQRKYRQLYQLDNTPAKTHALHAGISVAVGYLLGATPWLTRRQGMRSVVALYGVREILNRMSWRPLRFDYRHEPRDGVLDVLVPLIVVELWPWAR